MGSVAVRWAGLWAEASHDVGQWGRVAAWVRRTDGRLECKACIGPAPRPLRDRSQSVYYACLLSF